MGADGGGSAAARRRGCSGGRPWRNSKEVVAGGLWSQVAIWQKGARAIRRLLFASRSCEAAAGARLWEARLGRSLHFNRRGAACFCGVREGRAWGLVAERAGESGDPVGVLKDLGRFNPDASEWESIEGDGCCRGASGVGGGADPAQEPFEEGQVFGPGQFGVGCGVDDEFHGLTNELAGGGIVGDFHSAALGFLEGAAEDGALESLWGLDGPESGAVEGAGNEASVEGFFDGVRNGLGGDGGARAAGGFVTSADQIRGRAGAGGVLDGDEIGCRGHGLETVPDRVLSAGTAGGESEGFGGADLLSQLEEPGLRFRAGDQDDLVHDRAAVEAFPDVGDQRPPGHGQPELVHLAAHARAASGGHQNHAVHGASVSGGSEQPRGKGIGAGRACSVVVQMAQGLTVHEGPGAGRIRV